MKKIVLSFAPCIALFACSAPQSGSGDAAPASSPIKEVIVTEMAPAAIGPYSQAIKVGDMLWLAGQIGLEPATGAMVEGGLEPETRQSMANMQAVLKAAGMDFKDVVQTQVFLADMNDFQAFNAIYAEYFPLTPPARAVVEAARLPRDARVEIMMVAVRTK